MSQGRFAWTKSKLIGMIMYTIVVMADILCHFRLLCSLSWTFLPSPFSGLKPIGGVFFGLKANVKYIAPGGRPVAVRAEEQVAWDKISHDELADWKQQGPPTPLLDTVNFPVHIKNFNQRQLEQLCKELRAGEVSHVPYLFSCWVSLVECQYNVAHLFAELIHTVAKTGGHLGSSLGVVELTVAMHHVFNTPVSQSLERFSAYFHHIVFIRISLLPCWFNDVCRTIRSSGMWVTRLISTSC